MSVCELYRIIRMFPKEQRLYRLRKTGISPKQIVDWNNCIIILWNIHAMCWRKVYKLNVFVSNRPKVLIYVHAYVRWWLLTFIHTHELTYLYYLFTLPTYSTYLHYLFTLTIYITCLHYLPALLTCIKYLPVLTTCITHVHYPRPWPTDITRRHYPRTLSTCINNLHYLLLLNAFITSVRYPSTLRR